VSNWHRPQVSREELKKLGTMGETYDDVIRRLIKKAKGCEKT